VLRSVNRRLTVSAKTANLPPSVLNWNQVPPKSIIVDPTVNSDVHKVTAFGGLRVR
jgi:hypothetical protein